MNAERFGCLKRGCPLGILLAVFSLVVLIFFGRDFSWLFEAGGHLAAGAWIHARKNLPTFLANWQEALFPTACLAVALLLGHRFIRWGITASESKFHWRAGHTLAAAGLLLLGSAAAIAISGVAHHAAWLARTDLKEIDPRRQENYAISMTKNILVMLAIYHNKHGHYPDTLREACEDSGEYAPTIWLEREDGNIREPFVFLAPGAKGELGHFPAVVSPMLYPKKTVVVGFATGKAESMTLEEWEALDLKAKPQK